MAENPPTSPALEQVRAHLHTLSQLLRQAHHLEPEAQALIADLVEEMSKLIETPQVPSDEIARLTEQTTQLVQAVQQKEEPGVLEAARERLRRTIVAAETEAPVLVGITRRLVEMLSNLGI